MTDLKVVPFPVDEPDPHLRKMVADIGEAVESGAIDGLAVIGTMKDGSVMTAYVKGSHLFAMIGASSYMTSRLKEEIEEMVTSSGVS